MNIRARLALFGICCSSFILDCNAQRVNDLFEFATPSSTLQMHIHAMSHHWGHPYPPSIQLHTARASEKNVDVLFWTEHSQVYDQYFINEFNFKEGIIDSITNNITNVPGSPTSPVAYIAYNTGGTITTEINDSTLTMGLQATSLDSTQQVFLYKPQGKRGELKGTRQFIRPVSSSPTLNFHLTPHNLNDNGEAIININLTYHHYDSEIFMHRLEYRFKTNISTKQVNVLDDFTVEILVPIADTGRQLISLDLAKDAVNLLDGLDNTILSYEFGVSSSLEAFTKVAFDNITLYSAKSDPLNQFDSFNQFYHNYFFRYNVFGYQGSEWSADNGMHFNGYLPDTASDVSSYFIKHKQSPEIFTESIVKAGGLVTLNHPFGSLNYTLSDSILDYVTDTLSNYFIQKNAFNASIIEIAYESRVANQLHHLALWDKLMANNILIYGNGVNDLHGDGWDRTVNNFCVGLWTVNDEPSQILGALRNGRFFSVNTLNANSRFDFSVGNHTMGYKGESTFYLDTLKYQLDSNFPEADFRITQGLIKPGLEVDYIYNDYLLDENESYFLRLDEPCFIRMTVSKPGLRTPFIISNPIFITGLSSNIEEISDQHLFNVYPNPVKDLLKIDFYLVSNINLNIKLVDSKGKPVQYLINNGTLSKGWQTLEFSTNHLPQGVYYVNIDMDEQLVTRKIIISN